MHFSNVKPSEFVVSFVNKIFIAPVSESRFRDLAMPFVFIVKQLMANDISVYVLMSRAKIFRMLVHMKMKLHVIS